MENIMILVVFLSFLLTTACGSGGSCGSITWTAPAETVSSSGEPVYSVRSTSAGTMCSNINEYYDSISISEIVSYLQSIKLVFKSVEDSEYELELPQEITFGEVESCSFGTPPASNADCTASWMDISLQVKNNSNLVVAYIQTSYEKNFEGVSLLVRSNDEDGTLGDNIQDIVLFVHNRSDIEIGKTLKGELFPTEIENNVPSVILEYNVVAK